MGVVGDAALRRQRAVPHPGWRAHPNALCHRMLRQHVHRELQQRAWRCRCHVHYVHEAHAQGVVYAFWGDRQYYYHTHNEKTHMQDSE